MSSPAHNASAFMGGEEESCGSDVGSGSEVLSSAGESSRKRSEGATARSAAASNHTGASGALDAPGEVQSAESSNQQPPGHAGVSMQELLTSLQPNYPHEPAVVRRREIYLAHFALHRRNFIPLFDGVSEICLRPRKFPL